MSCNNNNNNHDDDCNNSLIIDSFDDLECNKGRIITVFTESGGCTGCGFTGLLVEVNCKFIKLITELPSAPSHPFGFDNGCCCRNGGFGNNFDNFGVGSRRGHDRCCRDRFGTAIVIPVCKIVSIVFNEI